MKHYCVSINGTNFLIKFDGEPKKMGFYATCFVDASDTKAAEDLAVQMLRDRKSLRDVVLNDRADPPRMYVENIAEGDLAFDEIQRTQPGLVWYAEDGTDPTQTTSDVSSPKIG
jgi:hypothetical protein